MQRASLFAYFVKEYFVQYLLHTHWKESVNLYSLYLLRNFYVGCGVPQV